MANKDVTQAISYAVRTRPGLSMDDLILCCAPYSWNQVILELDELVRSGAVTMKQGQGLHMITPCSSRTKERSYTLEASRILHLRSQV